MIVRLRGGGGGLEFAPVTFNSMNNPIIGRFAKEAPVYRILKFGFSLEGTCQTEYCECYQKKVIIPFCYGSFHISEVTDTAKCP